ncbi:hypothetical protein ALT_6655 [Aspergillus lentulus]|uniref:Uncharacterized protein n=1 Tax=Aspergillus lentulus TaxID=293939 RepID=A0AAN4PN59_ASPLE|nr:hypothetical protein CNMCM6069_008923 [Aspergillus lentulus]KAF4164454.1 hypothetical protein CNMCM6936_009116 [Aspergillus lentulus]KAF4181579.1 hypothetical protein CNMCM8060_008746 [Aspergillus lentulus]KAF4188728.1 hypothetical protein CNMCM7927_000902 [Aspergillus lentulus]KAF4195141.1 hypothetical protein CNMCM8694_006694 [Aspergillus lentulus]
MHRPKLRSRLRGQEFSEEQKQPFVEQSLHQDEEDGPDFDTASGTRSGCIAAVSTGVILSLLCLISGVYLLSTNKATLGASASISTSGREAMALAINVILALCTDGMMFVHSVSLRWALYREGRLEFNTNIRLFTSSERFGPNKWYINLVALTCLVLSYASSSVLLLSDQAVVLSENESPLMINGTALVALGLGLAGQAIIAVWCLVSSYKLIPTWSSNPLNTASAVVQNGGLAHRPGRCMLSVHQRQMSSQETYPMDRQGNMFQLQGVVRYILVLLWSLALLAIAWPIAIAAVSMSIGNASAAGQASEPLCWRAAFKWNKDALACSRNYVTLSMSPYANDHNPNSATFSYGAEAVLCVLFVCLIQASQTVSLHCLELLVSLSRDEGIWRQAYSETREAPGTQLATNPFRAAVSSWENAVLFIAKAVLHWIIGQSLIPSVTMEDSKDIAKDIESLASIPVEDLSAHVEHLSLKRGFQFDMVYSRLIIYATLAVLVATFATYLALRRRRGRQPAALGHLSTLVDLVDDWKTDQGGRMWWGDKTPELDAGQVRHAGTCWDKTVLGPICTTARYAGG